MATTVEQTVVERTQELLDFMTEHPDIKRIEAGVAVENKTFVIVVGEKSIWEDPGELETSVREVDL